VYAENRTIKQLTTNRYLTADYERSKFYLSQTNFDPLVAEHIIPIPSINSTSPSNPSESSHSGLPIAAIVGIAVGCLLLGMLAIILFIYLRRRSRATKDSPPPPDIPPEWYPSDKKHEYEDVGQKAELDARDSMLPGVELGGGERYEMAEMVAGPSSPLTPEMANVYPSARPEPVYEMVGDEMSRQEMPSPLGNDEVSPIQRVPSPVERMPSPIVPLSSLCPTEEPVTSLNERSYNIAGP
jgi:hypothetical protein